MAIHASLDYRVIEHDEDFFSTCLIAAFADYETAREFCVTFSGSWLSSENTYDLICCDGDEREFIGTYVNGKKVR